MTVKQLLDMTEGIEVKIEIVTTDEFMDEYTFENGSEIDKINNQFGNIDVWSFKVKPDKFIIYLDN